MGLINRLKGLAERITGKSEETANEYVGSSSLAVIGDPTASLCRELIVYTGATEKDIGIESEIRKVRVELNKVEERLDEATRGIEQMEHELNLRYAPSVREYNMLQEELMLLFQQRSNQQRSDGEPGFDDEDDDKDIELSAEELAAIEEVRASMEGQEDQEDAAKNAERVFKNNKRMAKDKGYKSKRAKDLFRKISKRTHPDKVKDPAAHEYFFQAKSAYEQNDADALQDIFDVLLKRGPGILRSMMSRLQFLIEERDAKIKAHAELRRTTEYAMWLDYAIPNNRPEVEIYWNKKLQSEIAKTIQAIRHLDPQRYKPKPAESFNMFKTGTKTVMSESESDTLDSPWE